MSILPSALISVSELNTIINDPALIILDASMPPVGSTKAPLEQWPDVTIPGARRFDIEKNFSDQQSLLPHTLPSAAQFQLEARALGINQDSLVAVYDNLGMFSSARAWFMLKAMGHKNVVVINGGLPAWLADGLKVEPANQLISWRGGDFEAVYDHKSFCDANVVESQLKRKAVKILDARALSRFTGQSPEPRAGVRAGHIPNSISFPYANLLEDGQLKTSSQLTAIFNAYDLSVQDELVLSCGSGITACILALAATIVGHECIKVYDGSWSDWGRDISRPIETNPVAAS